MREDRIREWRIKNPAGPAGQRSKEFAGMGKKKVLLVDDSMAIAKQLKGLVEESGQFEVVGHALNGIEGIKLFINLKPDLVFMDLVMPEMDGLQAIRSIRNLDQNARIVVISSAGGVEGKVEEALRFGAMTVISKPFEPEKIAEMLKGL
jgi:two-component system chemotaxis response regulator CheY